MKISGNSGKGRKIKANQIQNPKEGMVDASFPRVRTHKFARHLQDSCFIPEPFRPCQYLQGIACGRKDTGILPKSCIHHPSL